MIYTVMIHTVLGSITKDELGVTLMHEHVVIDYGGADNIRQNLLDRQDVIEAMYPFLRDLKNSGCQTFVDATPPGNGRDVLILKECALKVGMNFVTCTGTFRANGVPAAFKNLSIDNISDLWVEEYVRGIEGTGIKPGFIKIALDDGNISSLQEKILRAAIHTSLRTGMCIQAHTILPETMLEALTIIEEEGLAYDRYIWTHADCQEDISTMINLGRQGIWLQIDSIGYLPYERHVKMLLTLLEAGLEDQLLLSQDKGWYVVGKDRAKYVNPYHYMFTKFVPLCKDAGISETTLAQLLVQNPAEVLDIKEIVDI